MAAQGTVGIAGIGEGLPVAAQRIGVEPGPLAMDGGEMGGSDTVAILL